MKKMTIIAMNDLLIGDKVKFTYNGKILLGTIYSISPKGLYNNSSFVDIFTEEDGLIKDILLENIIKKI